MAIIVILCGAPHLYKKDMNNSGLYLYFQYLGKRKKKKPIKSLDLQCLLQQEMRRTVSQELLIV